MQEHYTHLVVIIGMKGDPISAAERISIGNNVNIDANSTIIDTDFNPLDAIIRRKTPQSATTAPITIEDGVYIGMDCLILKGVKIGKSSVVGAGSVVRRDVPEGIIVAGNPARAVR